MSDEEQPKIFEVAQLYEGVTELLESGFGPRQPFWVRGEIVSLNDRTHAYIDIVDTAKVPERGGKLATLKGHCWKTKYEAVKRSLREKDFTLAPGMVVNFYGHLDLYTPTGSLGFNILNVDVQSLLGDAAKRREELLATLGAEGLLEKNKLLPFPAMPLKIGVVASKGTEGYNDFLNQLTGSGMAFVVTHVQTTVQGDAAPAEIVRALRAVDEREVDVIVVIRGGGSKGDLACFDDESVARAIADARHPVVTGIGHTGDTSIADLVAHQQFITPSALGTFLADTTRNLYEHRVTRPAERLQRYATAVLDEAANYTAERRRTVVLAVRDRLRSEQMNLAHVRGTLTSASKYVVESAGRSLTSTRALLAAYDPQRRLAQGWAIVSAADGSIIRSVAAVAAGETITVRVADGSFDTMVQER